MPFSQRFGQIPPRASGFASQDEAVHERPVLDADVAPLLGGLLLSAGTAVRLGACPILPALLSFV